MHLLASGVHGMLSAYRTYLCLCVIYHLTNSFVNSYPAQPGASLDSRTEKLRLISKRLAHSRQHPVVDNQALTAETLELIMSLTTNIGTGHNTAHKRAESGDPYQNINPGRRQTRLEVLRRVYRQASGDPLVNFNKSYTVFYSALVPFLQALTQRLKPGSSSVLVDVTLISSLLPLNDPAFEHANIDSIMKKLNFLQQALKIVLQRIPIYVQDGYKSWFASQAKDVEYTLSLVMFSALSLPFYDDLTQVSVMSCGISCVNTGTQAGISPTNMTRIIDLVHFLMNTEVGTMPA